MKLHIYQLAFIALTAFTVSSCKDTDINDEHHYDNKLYISSVPVTEDLLIKEDVLFDSRKITYRLAAPVDNEIQVSFDAKPSLTATYNLCYGDNATALPEAFYDIPVKNVTIQPGGISGDDIIVNFVNLNQLDDSRRYVLPVTITNVSGIGLLESARTTSFIIKGAALINVVANIKENYFPIKWNSDVSKMITITVEALVRSDDWVAKRDNALSSVFGIEGNFLIRIGDGDRPRDQLQAFVPGGSFPPANHAPGIGLPVDEWVHIAVVYNTVNKNRIYYKNGVAVYKDQSANSTVDLTKNCYIGRSFDGTRWLPGEISEVRIWSVERTAEQIADNPYKVNPASEGLVAYWKFNEGSGKVVIDRTGNGNDITASKDPIWVPVELPQIY